jgi:lysine decarboxylase
VGTLAAELARSVERHRGRPRAVVGPASYRVAPVAAVPPREAYFAAAETVPVERAVGRVAAELVAPYPPGIPVLAPGELVTADVLGALREASGAGVRIAYAADPSLRTLRVLAG